MSVPENTPDPMTVFPWFLQRGDRTLSGGGMTLRDWFAGQALVGGMAGVAGDPAEFAEEAYAIADAMLAEREKGGAA